MFADSEPFATEHTLLGLDPNGFGNGSAFAVASFGRVGAKAQALDTVPDIFDEPVKATAEAQFTDQFMWGGESGNSDVRCDWMKA